MSEREMTLDEYVGVLYDGHIAKKELAELRSEFDYAYCSFCGQRNKKDLAIMAEHMLSCEKHPLVKRIEQLESALEVARKALDEAKEELMGCAENWAAEAELNIRQGLTRIAEIMEEK